MILRLMKKIIPEYSLIQVISLKKKAPLEKVYLQSVNIERMINALLGLFNQEKMLHDNKKKTIYYDHAIVKVYDIPIFYFPKFLHPDPTVDRRSGFLPPTLYDSKNLGSGISLPYFINLGADKNFTLTNRIYSTGKSFNARGISSSFSKFKFSCRLWLY